MKGIGMVDRVWIGYASDQAVRLNAASGGIITGSLIGLLETGFIDGAVVNIPDPDFPPRGKSILAKIKEELLHSAKSIYCVTEISRGLNIAKYDDSIKKLAVVVLPCHISDLRKVLKKDVVLAEKVVLCFGLMCGHNILPSATIETLSQSGIDIKDVQEICYRSHGWYPFSYSVKMKDGSARDFVWPNSTMQVIWDSMKYQPQRCVECFDFAAEEADIACCDAWLDEYRGNREGYSIVLTHNEKGTSLVEHLIEKKILTLNLSDVSCIERSQYMQISQKRSKRNE